MSTVAIATNPEVLAEYGLEAKNTREREGFINLTLDYVQHMCGRSVDRSFTLLPRSTNFKGNLEKAQKFFTDSLKKAMDKQAKHFSADEEKKNPMPDIDLPDSVLSRLANISSPPAKEASDSDRSNGLPHNLARGEGLITMPEALTSERQGSKGSLIQELRSEEASVLEPEHSLERSASAEHLVLKVALPGVTTVSDCQLDISEVCMDKEGFR